MNKLNSARGVASVLIFGMGALVYGCGTSNQSPGTGNGAEATKTDAATFEQLTANVTSTASDYQGAMMGPSASSTSCTSVHDQYDAEVRPMISRMLDMSASMDSYMSHHGGATSADYGCMSATMMDELDYHRSHACASADLSADQLEVTRHVTAMTDYGNHMWDRCQEVMGTLDGTSAGFSAMAAACQSWDGQCTEMMHSECCDRSGGHTDMGGHMGNGSGMMDGTTMMGSCVDW